MDHNRKFIFKYLHKYMYLMDLERKLIYKYPYTHVSHNLCNGSQQEVHF